jgi:hypothetical protein
MDGIKTMDKSRKDQDYSFNTDDDMLGEDEYDEMELLERLETLREDMEDLGVSTLTEVIQRIEVLHQRMDRKEHAPRQTFDDCTTGNKRFR